MEVAVSMNDGQTLSPSLQQPHRHSRYSTPDTPNARSPHRNEPSSLPIAPLQEPTIVHNPSLMQTQHSSRRPHVPSSMEAGGQAHDRMDTDDGSETSGSGGESPAQEHGPASPVSVETPAVPDTEAMDITPDTLEAGEVGLPSSPQHDGHEPSETQEADNQSDVNHNLVRTNSRGSEVESRGSTPPPPRSNAQDPFLSVIVDARTGQPVEPAGIAPGNWTSSLPAEAESSLTHNVPDAPASESPPPPPTEQERNESGGQEEDSPDEDSADEEEQPYWASFVADNSSPSEGDVKLIEQEGEERSALDHELWEKLAFEALEDPEYVPTATGRIEWTFKGYHGTPENPNKELVMRSPSVAIGGYYWNIKLYPRGNENTDYMSVYVECSTSPREAKMEGADTAEVTGDATPQIVQADGSNRDPDNAMNVGSSTIAGNDGHPSSDSADVVESFPTVPMQDAPESQPSWEVPAQVLCIAYNPEEPRVNAHQKVMHRYHRDTADWGWTRFHGPWDTLHRREPRQRRALLQNDTLSFTAYIRTVRDETGALWWHSPANRLEWDSFERLGLNRLWVGSPESSAVLGAISTWLHITPLCSSITRPVTLNRPGKRKFRERPFHAELERIRGQLASPIRESEEALSLMNVAEMLDWNDAGDCEPDVVSNLDILRRALSWEASRVTDVTDISDIFEDVLLVRQPNAEPSGFRASASPKDQPKEKWLSSVQETLDAAAPYAMRDTSKSGRPSVLQVELHRQTYEVKSRKWKKLTHRITLDGSIIFKSHGFGSAEYTLFGIVVHSGDLESRDYYTVIRPGGPCTRWIKYSGDKSSKGVECLTTKQALQAHEGSDTASETSAVAYLVTYVRADLLRPQEVTDDQEDFDTLFTSHPHTASAMPYLQDLDYGRNAFTIESESSQSGASSHVSIDDAKASEVSIDDAKVPAYIYQSSIFGDHQGLGVAVWDLIESDDDRLLRIEVTGSMTLGDLVDAIDEARRAAIPGVSGKYALWFLDTVKGNRAMENIVRAPELIPLSVRGPDSLLKHCHTYHRVCRMWLDDSTPVISGPTVTQSPPEIDPPAPHSSGHEDVMQVDEEEPDVVTGPPAPTETNAEGPSGTATAEPQVQQAEDGDTVMEGNADPDAVQGNNPVSAKRVWNANLDTKVNESFDNVFVFLKVFDAENQTLNGVKTMWVKQLDRVEYTVRQALDILEDVPIEIYQEQSLSTLDLVRSGSNYQDIAGASTYILDVQRQLGEKDLTRLTAAGKPTTIPMYFNYQCSACDPAYLRSHITTSYFASPYFSGSIAYGRPHGQGTLISTLGDAYTGEFVSGLKFGEGRMNFANGDTYTGSWAHDEPHGEGKMVYAKTGNVYQGGFKKRKRHGKGVMHFEVADEEERLCGICYEEEMDCCFYDCGHVTACETCARQLDICPICRKVVKGVVKMWRS